MKTALVTGSDGFVGRHLVEALKTKYHVVGTMRRESDFTPRPHGVVEYRVVDITDRDTLNALILEIRPDFILHLAAKTTAWFQDPYGLFDANVTGTLNLYESVATQKEETGYNPKIIYVGTSEAYGLSFTAAPITEKDPFLPSNLYGASKAAADVMSFAYTRSRRLNIVIARPFTHTGPGQKMGFLVPDIASQVALAERAPSKNRIYVGRLDTVRDYSDVRDVARAYMLLLEAATEPGQAYNVCSGVGIKIKDLLSMICSLAKTPLVIEEDPNKMRPSDVPKFVGDNGRLIELTGWQPAFPIQRTIEDTLDYWRSRG